MIKSILKNLNGKGSEAASLEAALFQLGRDRDETRTKIAELKKQRHTALLDDLDDAAIGKIDLLIDRAEVKLEKLNAAEPPLLEKLTAARSAARQRRWRALRDAYLAAAGDFLTSARATAERHADLIRIVDQAQREGFGAEVAATMPATPNVNSHPLLAPDLLNNFERAIAPPPPPARQATAAAPTTRSQAPKPQNPESLQHSVNLRASRTPDDTSPLLVGEARVSATGANWSPADDRPATTHRGQKLRMPAGAARAAEGRGLVKVIEVLESYVIPPAAASAPGAATSQETAPSTRT
jgi:hypothetical protein